MQTALIVIHVIISLVLIVVVLMQHGKQQGLSGAIAGGAETFFGKNKGRTIDAALKKVTAVVAILFVLSSIVLAAYSIDKSKAEAEALNQTIQSQVEAEANAQTDAE
ncbi:MAG: preprotein translocase subunit SecG [Clostridia bacterium]|nr:preprotein translocase subunit SecG [Clostridia bacterium]